MQGLRRRRGGGIAASPHLWLPASQQTRWRLAVLQGRGRRPPSGHEDDTPVAPGVRPGLLDLGERHGVDVEGDLTGSDLPEQAVIGGRGIREPGPPANPAADQLACRLPGIPSEAEPTS
jgi:hypothetical protein